MRSANLLNDFAFKYVFGEDCKEANDALKSLLTVFLERSVNKVVVKNSEIVKDFSKMKSPRLDLLVEFDDRTTGRFRNAVKTNQRSFADSLWLLFG